MAEYRVTVKIERASGVREYLIDAASERDAQDRVLSGEGQLDEEHWTNIEYGDIEVEEEL